MLALLFLVSVATADVVIDKKILPIYEDALIPHTIPDAKTALRSWCIDDCHHHIVEKPVITFFRNAETKFDVHYLPFGLNNLLKTPFYAPLKDLLMTRKMVGIIAPMAKFPFELFPGLLESDLLIPEHHSKVNFIYKEAPIIGWLSEEDFKKFNEHRDYKLVADMAMDEVGFTLFKDYAQLNRRTLNDFTHETVPGLYYVVPNVATTHDIIPSHSGVVPLSSSEYIRYLSSARTPYVPTTTTTTTNVKPVFFYKK